MSGLQDYKCPCCGGAVEFNTSAQKMKCPFCETEFDISALQTYENSAQNQSTVNANWENDPGQAWEPGEQDGMRVYHCDSCGGEIVCDENTAATSCPYCDNPVVMKGQLSGMLKPDYIIPFKLDKNAAKQKLKQHYGGKKLLPKVFKEENHIDEVKGVYVPFWLFDANVNANIRYKAETTRSWSDSRYNYTETSHFALDRSGNISFQALPVDGSSNMADDLMESIEPFDIKEAVPFSSAYLAGFLADKYDVDVNQSIERANERIKISTEAAIASQITGYNAVTAESSAINLYNTNHHYALYPVWLLNTTWKGQKYTFAMNGQTGKFVGNLPIDKSASKKWFIGLTAGITAAFTAVTYLIYLLG